MALRFGLFPAVRTICNAGIAWGIALPAPALWFGVSLCLVIVILNACWASSVGQRLAWMAIVLGGGVNTADRLYHGCVADYFHPLLFPSFNVADMMIFLGVLFLLVSVSGIFPKIKSYGG